jgi:hypothetical protein
MEKFYPWLVKMAYLCQTSVSRHAATRIIRAAAHMAAKSNVLTDELLQSYLVLCQDPDISISRETLSELSVILKAVPIKSAEIEFFPEVTYVVD